MGIKKMALAAALSLSMASTPVLAQTAAVERSAPVLVESSAQEDDDGGYGGTTTFVIGFFVIIVIALGIYFATDGEDDGQTSP